MPKIQIEKEFARLNIEYEYITTIIKVLAELFEVSREAMKYRLINLHLIT
jgi:hypothetical protein